MFIYLTKLLPLLVLPIGMVIECLLIALVLYLYDKRRAAIVFVGVAVVVLWVTSMPLTAETLMGKLESAYPPVAMTDIPVSQCVVVLGGAIEPASPPRLDIELGAAADRVLMTARLYRAGKASVVIVAGGNLPWSPHRQSEAEAIRTLLVQWGVPASAILLDKVSQNTSENVINSSMLINKLDCQIPLLVTSAAHMQRAVATFKKARVEVFPVSTDVRVVRKLKYTVLDFLPDATALAMSTDAIREWLGQGVYRLRGI